MSELLPLRRKRISDRLLCLLLIALCFSIPFLIYADELGAGNTIVGGDGLITFYDLIYLKELLQDGTFPLWDPYLTGGTPRGIIAGAPGLYPFNWLIALFPVAIQMYVYFGVHLAMGGSFMYGYLRRISCSKLVSFLAGIMYVFTVHMGGMRKEHTTLIVTALYVPVVLYFAERYLQKRELKWLFCCSGAMALQFLGGFLQYVIYADIAAFFYLLTSGIHHKFSWKQTIRDGILWIASYFGMCMSAILGTAQFMLFLSDASGSQMPFEGFIGSSLHPIKLLETVLPGIFGPDVWSAFIEKGYSSGMDAELIMGAAAVCMLMASFALFRKRFHVRYMICLLFASLLYASMGHVPLMAKIFYHMPVLNLFRVPSRTLFLFSFAAIVLIACSMEELNRNIQHYQRLHVVNLCMIGLFVGTAILYSCAVLPYDGERLAAVDVFFLPGILFFAYLLVFYLGYFLRFSNMLLAMKMRVTVPVLVAGLMVVQVVPYYTAAGISNIKGNMALPDSLIKQVSSYKVWSPDVSCVELAYNSPQTYPIQGLNGYMNFNLPNLNRYFTSSSAFQMNASGMYNSTADSEGVLSGKNDVLSMLGVKYIMVSPERDLSQYSNRRVMDTVEQLLAVPDVELVQADGYQSAGWPIALKKDGYYQIQLTLSAEYSGDEFYVDFYSVNSGLDQRHLFTAQAGTHEYSAILPSGDGEQGEDVYFRIVALTMQNLNVTNVQVSEVSFDGEPLYGLFAEQTGYNIYENQFAKELIYAPERVIPIRTEDVSLLYTQTASYDLLNTSYLTNGENECDFSQTDVSITDIQLKNNSASAQVTADGDCFLNFSQTYYPGWNAYVDGDQVELYEVNGLIQGIFVPAGTHVVEFRFQPIVFYIGCGISLLTVMACVLYGVFEKRKHRILK